MLCSILLTPYIYSILSFSFYVCVFAQVRLVFNKSVSWVRVRDDHILTVDQITFIADERFHAYHATENGAAQQQSSSMSTLSNQRRQLGGSGGGTNSVSSSSSASQQKSHTDSNAATNAPWTLQIKYVQARDAGLYECQISSEPKISARVYLHVVGKLRTSIIPIESIDNCTWIIFQLFLSIFSFFVFCLVPILCL